MIPIIPATRLQTYQDAASSGLKNPPPLSLYIHIPWCVRKCPYCDFNSHELKTEIPEKQYIDALIADLEQATPKIWGRKIRSIFFGGGTPSLFSAESIDRILSQVRALTPLEYNCEITLEANPGTVDIANFKGYQQAGINRLSLGIQSFHPQHLQALGRIHDREQALQAVDLAMQTFPRVNLDVMYALPNQSIDEALRDAAIASELAPSHLSFYHLTLEPNTAFHRTPPPLPDDDTSAEMQMRIEELLALHGYQHYETSAFCKPNQQARHNLNYWTFGDYVGIGAGAHSKLSYHDKITREARPKHPKQYIQQALAGKAPEEVWAIEKTDLAFEFMMNALRLKQGFDPMLFQQRTGMPWESISPRVSEASKRGFLEVTPSLVKPTQLGQRFLNDLLAIFLD